MLDHLSLQRGMISRLSYTSYRIMRASVELDLQIKENFLQISLKILMSHVLFISFAPVAVHWGSIICLPMITLREHAISFTWYFCSSGMYICKFRAIAECWTLYSASYECIWKSFMVATRFTHAEAKLNAAILFLLCFLCNSLNILSVRSIPSIVTLN